MTPVALSCATRLSPRHRTGQRAVLLQLWAITMGPMLSLQDTWATTVLSGSASRSDAGTGADRAAMQRRRAGAACQHVAEREKVPVVLCHLFHPAKENWA